MYDTYMWLYWIIFVLERDQNEESHRNNIMHNFNI